MSPEPLWNSPLECTVLDHQEVHVWRVPLDLAKNQLHSLAQTLAADELDRAGRFHFPRDRDHYIVGRGALREILGRYLQLLPDQLAFSYTPYGKPFLTEAVNLIGLRFNLSHSGDLGLVAVTLESKIGVDIEYIRADLAGEEIARRYFSPAEVKALLALPREQQIRAFFTCWTRKEAYIKARGEGLSMPLDQFDVSLTPGEEAVLLSTRPDPEEAAHWRLAELSPGPGYVAALAVGKPSFRLQCWQWRV